MKVKRSFISTDTCSNFELAKQSPNEDCCQTDHFYVNNIKVGRIDTKNAWSYIMLACMQHCIFTKQGFAIDCVIYGTYVIFDWMPAEKNFRLIVHSTI